MPMTQRSSWLSPQQLQYAPQLAALATLDVATEIAVLALAVASHPAMTDDERPYWLEQPPRSYRIAKNIVALADRLHNAILTYQNQIAHEQAADNTTAEESSLGF
jgi:hypothetical protein